MSLDELTLARVMDTMAEGLFVTAPDCRIILWNRAMETLTGYPRSEVLGQACSLLGCEGFQGCEDGHIDCPLQKLQQEGIERIECNLKTKGGEFVPVLKNATLLRDEDGSLLGIVETVTDLRPLRQLEQKVTQFQTKAPAQQIGRLVGKSFRMQRVYEGIGLAAQSESTVLVLGETGTGKELVAEAIHFDSPRKHGPLIKVNCSALSEGLLESELFGHVKGAFTGAIQDKIGRFEAAHGGTLFLDEIGDISPLIQLKLLRVLQEREFERVGSSTTQKVDVRVIAATNKDLRDMVRQGLFREDLFYRLRVFAIDVPPLRQRKEDIPLLVAAFMERFNKSTGKAIANLNEQALHCFMDYCWPGNVRQLENAIEHAYVTCQSTEIGLFDLPVEIRRSEFRGQDCDSETSSPAPSMSPPPASNQPLTRDHLLEVLHECQWNKAEAARRLNLNRATIWRKMKQWDIALEASLQDSEHRTQDSE